MTSTESDAVGRTPVSLRAATVDDLTRVLEFWRGSAEGTDRHDSPAGLRALIDHDPQALILAVEPDGAVVGTVIAGWDGWRCHLYRLAVRPDRRRRGLGRLLLEAAEQRFTALGGHRFDAMVLDDNTLGGHAWRAAGYRPQPEWSRWVKPRPEPVDAPRS